MSLSRRDFINTVSIAAASVCLPADRRSRRAAVFACDSEYESAVLDLGSECVLRESLLGYRGALVEAVSHLTRIEDARLADYRSVIVPGAGTFSESTAEQFLRLLESGTQLLLESAAGFCDPSDFKNLQSVLQRYFNVTIEPAVNLWSLPPGFEAASRISDRTAEPVTGERAPYIDYVWPANLTVRDFSCVIPISAKPSDVIAYVGSQPVAVRKQVSHGTLVFLGSPLGPGLRAGEPEAHSLLRLFMTCAVRARF